MVEGAAAHACHDIMTCHDMSSGIMAQDSAFTPTLSRPYPRWCEVEHNEVGIKCPNSTENSIAASSATANQRLDRVVRLKEKLDVAMAIEDGFFVAER